MSILKEIQNQVRRLSSDIGLVAALITACAAIITHAVELIKTPVLVYTLIAAILLVMYRVFKNIRTESKYFAGQKTFVYSEKQRELAKKVTITVTILSITGTITLVALAAYKYFKPIKAIPPSTHIGIIINKFSNTKEDDLFTNDLFTNIGWNKKMISDSIKAEKNEGFLATLPLNSTDTINAIFKRFNYTKGIFVLGHRAKDEVSGAHVFRCVLCINNLKHLIIDSSKVDIESLTDSTIFIKNPKIIDLGPTDQAKAIADFILGLLNYNAKNFIVANKFFTGVIGTIDSSKNQSQKNTSKKFIGQCHLYMGGIHFNAGNFTKAKEEYELGLKADTTNANLHYNVACMYKIKGENLLANKHYISAYKLNSDLWVSLIPGVNNHSNQLAKVTKRKETNHKEQTPVITFTPSQVSVASSSPVASAKSVFNSPQTCDSSPDFKENLFNQEDIIYMLIFLENKNQPYYVTATNDLILFNNKDQYVRIGRMVFTKNLEQQYRISDFCGNEWLTNGSGKIMSDKKVIGSVLMRE